MLAPRAGRADTLASPPLVHVLVILGRTVVVVQHRADPAPEVRVDELAGALPAEVRVVQLVVAVQPVQVLGELLRRLELVHVDVGTIRRAARVIRGMGAHHDGQHVVPVKEKESNFLIIVLIKTAREKVAPVSARYASIGEY